MGISLEPKAKIISEKIAKASMDVTAGGVIKAKTDPYKEDGSITHDCRFCIDGDIEAKLSLKAEAELKIIKKIKVTSPNLEIQFKIADFYYSADFNEFAFTVCPHHRYLVKAAVLDKNSKPVTNAYVEDGIDLAYHFTDDNGIATFYMPAGEFTLKAYLVQDTSVSAEKKITVKDKAKDVKIVLKEYEVSNDEDNITGVKYVEIVTATTAAVMEDGRLYTWGMKNVNGSTQHTNVPVNILDNIDKMKLSSNTSAAISKDGKLYAWGYNGKVERINEYASRMLFFEKPILLTDNVKSVNEEGSLKVITNDGDLLSWKRDGETNDADYDKPPVKLFENVRFSDGEGIVTRNNELYFQNVKIANNVVDFKESITWVLDSDIDQTYGFLTTDRTLYLFGNNVYGQLCNGESGYDKGSEIPIKILDNIIDFGVNPSCWALDATGTLYTWGDNQLDLLGTGDNKNRSVPTKILNNVKEVFDDYADRMAAITQNGDLYVWGVNNKGCLGIGTNSEYCNTPIKILENVRNIVHGAPYSTFGAAITNDNELYMWGDNSEGQLGDNTQTIKYSPIKIMDNVKLAYLGSDGVTAAITNDGELYMWGCNTYGQLGNGTNISSSIPVKINFSSTLSEVYKKGLMDKSETEQIIMTNADNNIDNYVFDNVMYGDYINGRAVFTKLNANELYNIYEIKSKDTEDILQSENLLYIAQTTSDNAGTISYEYEPRESHTDSVLFAVGINPSESDNSQIKDIKNAVIGTEPLFYTGQEQTAKIEATYNDVALTNGIDYELHGEYKAVNVGEYAAEIKGIGSYTGTKSFTWKIQENPLEEWGEILSEDIPSDGMIPIGLWIAGVSDCIYSGDAVKQELRVYDYKKLLTEKTDYTITYKNNTSVGKATITVTGKGNYVGKETADFQILPADLSEEDCFAEAFYVKTGKKAQYPVPVLYYMGTKLKYKKDFTISYSNTSGIYAQTGEHSATITGIGNYTGTKTLKLTAVEKIPKKISISIAKASLTGFEKAFLYTGKSCKQNCALYISTPEGEKQLTEGIDYTVRYIGNTKAGTATVIYSGKNGYAGKLKKTYKIMPYDIANDVETKLSYEDFLKCSYAKGGSKPKPVILFGGKRMTEGADYTLSYKNNKAAYGNQTPCVVVNGKGSFKGKLVIYFTITPQDLSKMTLVSCDKVYQNKAGIYRITPKLMDLDGKMLSAGKDFDKNNITYVYANDVALEDGTLKKAGDIVEDTDMIPAGTSIRVTFGSGSSGNYEGTFSGTYRIVKSDIKSAKITIPNQTYTGKEILLDKSQITVTLSGTVLKLEDYDIVQYADNVKKGKASVTIKGNGNYGGTKTVKFNIGAKGFLWWWK